MALDTLAYTKHLESAGIARAQAEAHAEALRLHIVPDLAAREDITRLELKIEASEARLIAEIQKAVTTLHGYGLRLLGIGVAALALFAAILRFV